ncbi:V(D)J recombination-activating protein 1-like [Lytechinus pictus]|uniref:V(D)J recombination-activating protein 1-like n=1 Tax=Lytechinus pictus TaxID=7653 RepID=UPI0030B9E6EC
MEESTQHASALSKLCRVCAQVISSPKNMSSVKKYAEALLALYKLDIHGDQKGTHPQSICNKCRMTVTRAFKSLQSGKVFTGVLPALCYFSHHQRQCHVCDTYSKYLQSIQPEVPMPAVQPTSTSAPSELEPSIVSVTRTLFSSDTPVDDQGPSTSYQPFTQSVPDPGSKIDGAKRVWSAKTSLRNVGREYARKRTSDIADSVADFCLKRKEDKTDVLYFLLSDSLRESGDQRLKEVMASWNDELSMEMTVEQCLAMRVTTMTSKNRYKEQYAQMKDVLKPPHVLDEAEKTYMPGSVRFRLEGGAELIQHTPVKGGRWSDSNEYGNINFEPLPIGGELHNELEVPVPNFKGVQWPYSHALAKTLEELDEDIALGLASCGLEKGDDPLILTMVKDGADGMGDVSIIKEKGDRILPDKAFRAAFAVIKCEVVLQGKRCTVYEPKDPNSVLITRPLVEAIGDENNHASSILMLDLMEHEREVMKDKVMSVNVGNWWRRHKLSFYNSMIDEKLDRAESGLQASGSKFLCTLCTASRQTARENVGSFEICRTLEDMKDMANYVQVNPDKKSAAELNEIAEGVKDYPVLKSSPKQKLIDATHADINMGSFFKKLIICEVARIQSWAISETLKPGYEHAEKAFDDHAHETLGIVPKLMMPGNYARQLFKEANQRHVLALIPDSDRREKMGEIFHLFRQVRQVYRAHHPGKEDIASYKEKAIRMGRLLDEHFTYASWPNYLHKLIEHVQEVLEDEEGPGTIGGLSGEGNEGANKVFRDLRRHFSRKSSAMLSLRDVIWFHWLYTSPKLRRIAQVTSRDYSCSKCQKLGHSAIHCSNA